MAANGSSAPTPLVASDSSGENGSTSTSTRRGRSSSGISNIVFGTRRDRGELDADLRKIGSWNSYRIGKYLGLSGSVFFTAGLFLLYIFGDYFHHEVASVSSTAVAAFGLLQLALATVLVIYAFCKSLHVEMPTEPM